MGAPRGPSRVGSYVVRSSRRPAGCRARRRPRVASRCSTSTSARKASPRWRIPSGGSANSLQIETRFRPEHWRLIGGAKARATRSASGPPLHLFDEILRLLQADPGGGAIALDRLDLFAALHGVDHVAGQVLVRLVLDAGVLHQEI